MRRRVTFFHRPGGAVDPALLSLADTSLSGPDVEAAREDRITLALDELPDELRAVLAGSHELHARWAAPRAREAAGPLFARISPDLHLFDTPQQRVDVGFVRLAPR